MGDPGKINTTTKPMVTIGMRFFIIYSPGEGSMRLSEYFSENEISKLSEL
jgi:hypothetical protein